ncbi:MAG TPA: hypothetical protein VE971_01750 [Candidatus Eisenbacteria bacterium]|nr:hypothetical protein [Candidatus Eisenbacteria bacterium]
MSDLLFQNISTVQNNLQPFPPTIAAAATIAPVNFITILSGNTAVQTITPPVTGMHMICIVPGTTTGFTTGGNVSGGTTTVSGRAYLFVYNPITNGYSLVSSTTS